MPILRDFDIGWAPHLVQANEFGRLRQENESFRAFVEAIYWRLGMARIQAPFRKLVISLVGAHEPAWVRNALGVCIVELPTEPAEAFLRGSQNARGLALALVARGLDALAEETSTKPRSPGWEEPKLREIVLEVGSHHGPYTFEWKRLTKVDRSASIRWVPVEIIDDVEDKVVLQARNGKGDVVWSTVVFATNDVGMRPYLFNPKTMVLDKGSVSFRDSVGRVVAAVSVPVDYDSSGCG